MKKLFARNRKSGAASTVVEREPDFPVLEGIPYIEFLGNLHRARHPETYLEIGTQKGKSLALAECRSIAIDPQFVIDQEIVGAKPDLYLFQGTSDDFFESGYLARNEIRIDLAFLDGMHLFEFLLRDFIGTEANCSQGALVAMHDCMPYARVMAEREWDRSKTRSWTGDVWKLIPILRRYRPDLTVEVLDCPPTALTLVGGLDPTSMVLRDHYDEILAEFVAMTLDSYGVQRFLEEAGLVSSSTYLSEAG